MLSAADDAIQRMASTNQERVANDKPELKFGIGLHIGNVMFGNVGLVDRLTFSAFGAAVNTACRLEGMTKLYGTPVVASKDFRDYAGGNWNFTARRHCAGWISPRHFSLLSSAAWSGQLQFDRNRKKLFSRTPRTS